VVVVGRIDDGGLYERDVNPRAFVFEFHPEGFRKTFDGVFRRAVG
jgi:hypothetical protein